MHIVSGRETKGVRSEAGAGGEVEGGEAPCECHHGQGSTSSKANPVARGGPRGAQSSSQPVPFASPRGAIAQSLRAGSIEAAAALRRRRRRRRRHRRRRPAMAAEPEAADLAGTCWRDDLWLQQRGALSPATALDYFAGSPFYDRASNNEAARARGLRLEDL